VAGRRIVTGAALVLTAAVAVSTGGAPRVALVTLALLGVVALLGAAGPAAYPLPVAGATVAACAVVASYDNGWRATGWHAFPHTGGLVLTLAMVPFALAVVAGVRAVRAGAHRLMAVLALLTGTGWIGALTLPHLPAWGPIVVLVPLAAAGGATLLAVRTGRARAAAHRALAGGHHAALFALARALCPDATAARRLTVDVLAEGYRTGAADEAGGARLRTRLVRAALRAGVPPGTELTAALAPEQRVALALRYGAELPVPEIAALLGLTPPAVRRLVDDALCRLGEAARSA
jgi:hypothetical protein